MNTDILTIEGNNYQIIKGTQSDGRCFSASIFYDLYGIRPEDNKLNNWIQENIITPIIDTKTTDCSRFFIWATIWAGIHNGFISRRGNSIIGPVNISGDVDKLSNIFLGLQHKINEIAQIESEQHYDRNIIGSLLFDIIDKINEIKVEIPLFYKA